MLNFDLKQIESFLPMPKLQPAYRLARTHLSFLTNIPLTAKDTKNALIESWQAGDRMDDPPLEKIRALVQTKYADPEWIYKF